MITNNIYKRTIRKKIFGLIDYSPLEMILFLILSFYNNLFLLKMIIYHLVCLYNFKFFKVSVQVILTICLFSFRKVTLTIWAFFNNMIISKLVLSLLYKSKPKMIDLFY